MIYELIYTSAPETLDGAGYGAVGKSENFPARLENWIRQHLNHCDLPLDGAQGTAAAFSHVRWEDGGQCWHVCSRVGDGGYDHTRRAVFLAHHIAIPDGAIGPVNWAQFLRDPAIFQRQWDGRVGPIPPRDLEPRAMPAGHCDAWHVLAGDPRWALGFAEKWRSQPTEPQFLVTADAGDVLPLFGDVLELLSAEHAGRVNFLTYLNSERSGLRFDWVGLPAGTKMTKTMLARCPDRVLDLTQPLGPVPRSRQRAVHVGADNPPAAPSPVAGPSPAAAPPRAAAHANGSDRSRSNAAGPRPAPARAPQPSARPLPPPPGTRQARPTALLAAGAASALLLVAAGYGLANLLHPAPLPLTVAEHQPAGNGSTPPAKKPPNLVAAAASDAGDRSANAAPPAKQARSADIEDPAEPPPPGPTTPKVVAGAGAAAPPANGGSSAGDLPTIEIIPAKPADQRHNDVDSARLAPVVRFVGFGRGPASLKFVEQPEAAGPNDAWLELWEADVPLPKPTLRILSHPRLKLESQHPKAEHEPALRVFIRDQPELGSVTIRMQAGHVSWTSTPQAPEKQVSDQLLDALRLSVLEIAARPARPEQPLPRVHLVLTPLHPPVRAGGAGEANPGDANLGDQDWRSLYLSLAGELGDSISPEQLQALRPKLRIRGLSLSILPATSEGWPCSAALDLLASAANASEKLSFPLAAPEYTVSLTFAARLNRNAQEKRALEALGLKISRTEPPPALEKSEKTAPHPKLDPTGPRLKPETTKPHKVAGKDAAAEKDAADLRPKPPSTPGNGKKSSGPPDDPALLERMLRRYGELHGSIVVSTQDGNFPQEIEIFRFGR